MIEKDLHYIFDKGMDINKKMYIYKGMGIYRKGYWIGINSWKIRKIIKNVKMHGRKRSYPCVSICLRTALANAWLLGMIISCLVWFL
jgi:hypothetical protein